MDRRQPPVRLSLDRNQIRLGDKAFVGSSHAQQTACIIGARRHSRLRERMSPAAYIGQEYNITVAKIVGSDGVQACIIQHLGNSENG
jgi:hypothetical protein